MRKALLDGMVGYGWPGETVSFEATDLDYRCRANTVITLLDFREPVPAAEGVAGFYQ